MAIREAVKGDNARSKIAAESSVKKSVLNQSFIHLERLKPSYTLRPKIIIYTQRNMKKKLFMIIAAVFSLPFVAAAQQSICPIMVETEIDEEEVVKFEGKTIYMCCGSCIKAWEKNPDYYLKIGRELKLLPQFKEVSKELQEKLDKIKLMDQRHCPLRPECVVSPTSPFVEYEGEKIYFFKERDIERKWNKDPKAAFDKARKAGLLPQFGE